MRFAVESINSVFSVFGVFVYALMHATEHSTQLGAKICTSTCAERRWSEEEEGGVD